MKKQPQPTTAAATASAGSASTEPKEGQGQATQEKSTEKKSNDNKGKKDPAQAKSNEAPKGDQKAKKTGEAPAAAAAAPPKAYFTAGAQGDADHAYRTLDMLISLFEQAIRKAFPEDPTLPVLVVPGKQTDYQCNSAMPIASVKTNRSRGMRWFFSFTFAEIMGQRWQKSRSERSGEVHCRSTSST